MKSVPRISAQAIIANVARNRVQTSTVHQVRVSVCPIHPSAKGDTTSIQRTFVWPPVAAVANLAAQICNVRKLVASANGMIGPALRDLQRTETNLAIVSSADVANRK